MGKVPFVATIVMILMVALSLRVAAAVWWQSRLPADRPFAFDDSETYWALGKCIHDGQPYAYGNARVFRTPGYPLLLAAVIRVAGAESPLPARIVGAAGGTLSVMLLMYLATMLFSRRVAVVTGILAAVDPGSIAMSIFVLSESLFAPLCVATVVCTARMFLVQAPRRRLHDAIWAGCLSGAATLTRPSWLLFTPGLCVLLVVVRPHRGQYAAFVCMLAAWAVCLAPWWIRNFQIAGRFVPTTLQVGASLYDGWRPNATGASDMRFVPQFVAAQQQADLKATAPSGLFEDRLDQRMHRAAVDWAWSHPGRVVQLMGIKFLRMWSPLPHAQEFQNPWIRSAIALSYLPCLAAALTGVLWYGAKGWPYALCWLPAAYFSLLHMVFIGSIRYRQPPMLLLLVLAAAVLCRWGRTLESTGHEADFCTNV